MTILDDLPELDTEIATALEDAGYDDVLEVAVATPGKLSNDTEITLHTAKEVINRAKDESDSDLFFDCF